MDNNVEMVMEILEEESPEFSSKPDIEEKRSNLTKN